MYEWTGIVSGQLGRPCEIVLGDRDTNMVGMNRRSHKEATEQVTTAQWIHQLLQSVSLYHSNNSHC